MNLLEKSTVVKEYINTEKHSFVNGRGCFSAFNIELVNQIILHGYYTLDQIFNVDMSSIELAYKMLEQAEEQKYGSMYMLNNDKKEEIFFQTFDGAIDIYSVKLFDVLTDFGKEFVASEFDRFIDSEVINKTELSGVCKCGHRGEFNSEIKYKFSSNQFYAGYDEFASISFENKEEALDFYIKNNVLASQMHNISTSFDSNGEYAVKKASLYVESNPVCPSCGEKDFEQFGYKQRHALSLYDNEDSIVLSSISYTHELFERREMFVENDTPVYRMVNANYSAKFNDCSYVFKKTHIRLVTNKKTGRTYLVQPNKKSSFPMDISYSVHHPLLLDVFNMATTDEEKEILHLYGSMLLDAFHPVVQEKLKFTVLNDATMNSYVMSLRVIPQLLLLGDQLYDIKGLSPEVKKQLRNASNRNEAFKCLVPAITKKGISSLVDLNFENLHVYALFSNTGKLKTALEFEASKIYRNQLVLDSVVSGFDSPFDTPFDSYEEYYYVPTVTLSDSFALGDDIISSTKVKKILFKYFKSYDRIDDLLLKSITGNPNSAHTFLNNNNLIHLLGDTASIHIQIMKYLRGNTSENALLIKESIKALRPTSILDLHDSLSAEHSKITSECKRIEYSEKDMKRYTFSTGVYSFRPAVSNHELTTVGNQLSICVGGYAEQALNKSLTILLGFEKDSTVPFVCIEVKNSELKQVKEKYNALVQDANRINAIRAYSKHAKLVSNCYDTRHFDGYLLLSNENIELDLPI